MFTLYIVLSRIGFCAGTNTYSVYCQQTRHETAQTVHTGSIYAAILKIAAFSFIYFWNDSNSVQTTVKTARKAIRNKIFHFQNRNDATVTILQQESSVICVNKGPISYGFCAVEI